MSNTAQYRLSISVAGSMLRGPNDGGGGGGGGGGARQSLHSVLSQILGGGASRLNVAALAIGAAATILIAAGKAFGDYVASAVEASAAQERDIMTVSALIKANKTYRDDKGKELGSGESLLLAKQDSTVLVKQMQQDAKVGAGTLEDRMAITKQAIPFLRGATKNSDEMIKKARELANVGSAVAQLGQINRDQVARDIGLMISGRAGLDNKTFTFIRGQMNNGQGVITKDFNQGSAEKRLEFIQEAFNKLADPKTMQAMANTYDGIGSTLSDINLQFKRDFGEPIFESWKGLLADFRDKFINKDGSDTQQSKDISKAAKSTGGFVASIIDSVRPFMKWLGEFSKEFGDAFSLAMAPLKDLFGTMDRLSDDQAFRNGMKLGSNIGPTLSSLAKLLGASLKALAVALGYTVGVVVALVAIVGKSIEMISVTFRAFTAKFVDPLTESITNMGASLSLGGQYLMAAWDELLINLVKPIKRVMGFFRMETSGLDSFAQRQQGILEWRRGQVSAQEEKYISNYQTTVIQSSEIDSYNNGYLYNQSLNAGFANSSAWYHAPAGMSPAERHSMRVPSGRSGVKR